jgi:hypothetical protein
MSYTATSLITGSNDIVTGRSTHTIVTSEFTWESIQEQGYPGYVNDLVVQQALFSRWWRLAGPCSTEHPRGQRCVTQAATEMYNTFGGWEVPVESRDIIGSLWTRLRSGWELCNLVALIPPVWVMGVERDLHTIGHEWTSLAAREIERATNSLAKSTIWQLPGRREKPEAPHRTLLISIWYISSTSKRPRRSQ